MNYALPQNPEERILRVKTPLIIERTLSEFVIKPSFLSSFNAFYTGISVVSIKITANSELPRMYTPSVQKIMKESLFHSDTNRENRLILSIKQSKPEANFTLSQ